MPQITAICNVHVDQRPTAQHRPLVAPPASTPMRCFGGWAGHRATYHLTEEQGEDDVYINSLY